MMVVVLQAVLNEVIEHLGLADFLEVVDRASPGGAFAGGDKHAGVRRGRYAEKPSEWPAPKAWTAQLGAHDTLQVVYAQRALPPPGTAAVLPPTDQAERAENAPAVQADNAGHLPSAEGASGAAWQSEGAAAVQGLHGGAGATMDVQNGCQGSSASAPLTPHSGSSVDASAAQHAGTCQSLPNDAQDAPGVERAATVSTAAADASASGGMDRVQQMLREAEAAAGQPDPALSAGPEVGRGGSSGKDGDCCIM